LYKLRDSMTELIKEQRLKVKAIKGVIDEHDTQQ